MTETTAPTAPPTDSELAAELRRALLDCARSATTTRLSTTAEQLASACADITRALAYIETAR